MKFLVLVLLVASSAALLPADVPGAGRLRRGAIERRPRLGPRPAPMLSSAQSGGSAKAPRRGIAHLRSPEGRTSISVAVVLSAAFLNLLGFTMAGPITPALGRHFGKGVGASLGWLTSAYPIGMLGGLLLWPSLSDRADAKRSSIIALSLIGSGVGLVAQGYAVRHGWSLASFLALRALTGTMAGSSPIAKAYLADVGAVAGKLPRYMAWRDASSTLAFIVGPLLSGLLYVEIAVGIVSRRG